MLTYYSKQDMNYFLDMSWKTIMLFFFLRHCVQYSRWRTPSKFADEIPGRLRLLYRESTKVLQSKTRLEVEVANYYFERLVGSILKLQISE
jgi:hypothetical protein